MASNTNVLENLNICCAIIKVGNFDTISMPIYAEVMRPKEIGTLIIYNKIEIINTKYINDKSIVCINL